MFLCSNKVELRQCCDLPLQVFATGLWQPVGLHKGAHDFSQPFIMYNLISDCWHGNHLPKYLQLKKVTN